MTAKTVVAGIVASIGDDRDRTCYRFVHSLVRADGIGEWVNILGQVLTGPASRLMVEEAKVEHRELTMRCPPGEWQFDAAAYLDQCLAIVEPARDPIQGKCDLQQWFRLFARLRNKTRGHGAPRADQLARMCVSLRSSIDLIIRNLRLFQRPWAFIHRNLSGKYRVTALLEDCAEFNHLKTTKTENLPNGVYVWFGVPIRIELCDSNAEFTDFYLANGGWTESRFEMLSYITSESIFRDSAPYLDPAGKLPGSETEGAGELDIRGSVFTNAPAPNTDYVVRPRLEAELMDVVRAERHQIVTLVGRGGIGKTSLAIATIDNLSRESTFQLILWFSARDLDLLGEGPKPVRPAIVTTKDVAELYIRLVDAKVAKDQKAVDVLAEALRRSDSRTLFVFDNFETVAAPIELYRWIDTHVRGPNKVLITTRHREFKGDYPIEVAGMTEDECEQLIDLTASRLNVLHLLTPQWRSDLMRESDRHPYVVRILLGEVAKAGRLRNIERLVAGSDEILSALFERTYGHLSPEAQRVFLTVCSWRSLIPEVAIAAVLLRPSNERIGVTEALDELERFSFLERIRSEKDGQVFINTPLVALEFGRRKLAVSPMKTAVEADTELLQLFGAAQRSDIRHGVAPRVERLLNHIAKAVERDQKSLAVHQPIIEYLARHWKPAWLMLATLQEENLGQDGLELAKESVRRFLEEPDGFDTRSAWRQLTTLCWKTSDVVGEAQALVECCSLSGAEYQEISSAANRVNQPFVNQPFAFASEEKRILVGRLAELMEARTSEANGTDLSRLAWLCLHLKDAGRASKYADLGLTMEPDNQHLLKLKRRLETSV
ncbi:MAG: NB-ARC domain-containing protein [Planctomycetaceae bacterium]|nr:NB-ARC domain-containing protein [Planctomycetaceae bacterium]